MSDILSHSGAPGVEGACAGAGEEHERMPWLGLVQGKKIRGAAAVTYTPEGNLPSADTAPHPALCFPPAISS